MSDEIAPDKAKQKDKDDDADENLTVVGVPMGSGGGPGGGATGTVGSGSQPDPSGGSGKGSEIDTDKLLALISLVVGVWFPMPATLIGIAALLEYDSDPRQSVRNAVEGKRLFELQGADPKQYKKIQKEIDAETDRIMDALDPYLNRPK